MEIRNSGKIAFGVVAALASIGALHFFIFGSTADQFHLARARFDMASGRAATEGTPPNMGDINRFRYEALKARLTAWELISELDYVLPEYYDNITSLQGLLDNLEASLWEQVSAITRISNEGINRIGPLPRFMAPNPPPPPRPQNLPGVGFGQRPGVGGAAGMPTPTPVPADNWSLQRGLPQNIVANLDAGIQRLVSLDRTIQNMAEGSEARLAQEREFENTLRALGVDLEERDRISLGAGETAAMFYVMNRVDNVMRALPPLTFPNLTDAQRRARLVQLFRRQDPSRGEGDPLPTSIAQLSALVRILETARETQLQEIEFVRMHDFRTIRYLPPEEAAAAAAAAPDPRAGFGGFGFDESMMFGEDFFDFGMFGFEEFGGMGVGAGVGAPVAAGTPVGTAAPIELRVIGTNESVMNFLYAVGTGPRPFEIDRLRFEVLPPVQGAPQGRVRATVFVNVVASASFLSGFNRLTVERHIANVRNQLAEVAMLPEVRELALADGIIVMDGEVPRLAQPTPTPVPNAQALPRIVDPATLATPEPAQPQGPRGGGGRFGGARAF